LLRANHLGVLRGFESAYSQNEVAGTMQRFCLPTVTSDAQRRHYNLRDLSVYRLGGSIASESSPVQPGPAHRARSVQSGGPEISRRSATAGSAVKQSAKAGGSELPSSLAEYFFERAQFGSVLHRSAPCWRCVWREERLVRISPADNVMLSGALSHPLKQQRRPRLRPSTPDWRARRR
jgi:hypothetical protein